MLFFDRAKSELLFHFSLGHHTLSLGGCRRTSGRELERPEGGREGACRGRVQTTALSLMTGSGRYGPKQAL